MQNASLPKNVQSKNEPYSCKMQNLIPYVSDKSHTKEDCKKSNAAKRPKTVSYACILKNIIDPSSK